MDLVLLLCLLLVGSNRSSLCIRFGRVLVGNLLADARTTSFLDPVTFQLTSGTDYLGSFSSSGIFAGEAGAGIF